MPVNLSIPSIYVNFKPYAVNHNFKSVNSSEQSRDTIHFSGNKNHTFRLLGKDQKNNPLIEIGGVKYSIVPTGINVTGTLGQSTVTGEFIDYLCLPNNTETIGALYHKSKTERYTAYRPYTGSHGGQKILLEQAK